MKKIKIVDTTLRDAHQSLIATRMTTEQMLPILDTIDKAGYHAIEMWGGATFDVCMRYLNEDPWERLRTIKKHMKNTKLQMLLRGQNLVGYRHYADDVVDYFVEKAIYNGIDIVRIFDALNDMRNLERSTKAVLKEGGHAQIALAYTLSDVHTVEYYVEQAKRARDMGASSLCIKDMSGLLLPYESERLVKAIKSEVDLELELHSHYTSGLAAMSYLKGIEAGADIVDTAISSFSMGTSQPATEILVETLKGSEYDTGLNQDVLAEISDYFMPLREEALKSGLMNTKVLGVNIKTLAYQVPGGMLSNLVSQLSMQNAEDKYQKVLEEVPRVRADFGYPPLVTPSSQIVGTQAVLNVLQGERYKMIPKESKNLVKGAYGKTPVKIKDEIVKKIVGDEELITVRPADLLEKELEKGERAIAIYKEQDEDVLSYCLFPEVATTFFKQRMSERTKTDIDSLKDGGKVYPV